MSYVPSSIRPRSFDVEDIGHGHTSQKWRLGLTDIAIGTGIDRHVAVETNVGTSQTYIMRKPLRPGDLCRDKGLFYVWRTQMKEAKHSVNPNYSESRSSPSFGYSRSQWLVNINRLWND